MFVAVEDVTLKKAGSHLSYCLGQPKTPAALIGSVRLFLVSFEDMEGIKINLTVQLHIISKEKLFKRCFNETHLNKN